MKLINESRVSSLIALVGPAVTIFVNPWGNYDPISLPKLLVLATFAGILLGIILVEIKQIFGKNKNLEFILFCCFIFWSTIVILFADSPKDQQFWGVFGRNTGYLTYVSLSIIWLSTSLIRESNFAKKISYSLILTSFPVLIYGLIQILGRDFIKWSMQDVFGTLGNTNFLSAFLALPALVTVSFLLGKENSSLKSLFAVHLLVSVFVMLKTNSIQGPIIFGVGTLVLVWLRLWKGNVKKFFFYGWSFFSVILIAFIGSGVLGFGILSKFLMQQTLTFRFDYMGAAIKMIQAHPMFGVGFDAFGDWYRLYRGVISTYRTSPARTANTSHNIFLDVGSNGGIPLFIFYLGIVFISGWLGFRTIARQQHFDPFLTGLFACWIGYQLQALISINQIGVGIWNWIICGALISAERTKTISVNYISKKKGSDIKPRQLTPAAAISSVICGGLFFAAAAVPFNNDRNFRKAYFARDIGKIMKLTESSGSTAWHVGTALSFAIRANAMDHAREIDANFVERFPRDIYGLQAAVDLAGDSVSEEMQKIRLVQSNDPFYPCYWPNWEEKVLKMLTSLPVNQQEELVKSWTLPRKESVSGSQSQSGLATLDVDAVRKKIHSFCFQS